MRRCFLILLAISSQLYGSGDSLFIDQTIATFMEHEGIPGMAVAIYDGKSETILCYGIANTKNGTHVTPDTIFELASVTKVFTTTALALHVLQGDMLLSDPISKYLPGINPNFGAINKVTLLHLATHSSSLPRVLEGKNGRWYSRENTISFLQNWHPSKPIGSHYLYSNLAFGLLGYALENVEHRNYQGVVNFNILNPLNMKSTFTDVPAPLLYLYAQGHSKDGSPARKRPNRRPAGSGALRSTARDMIKFLTANLKVNAPEKLVRAMQYTHQPFYKVNDNLTMGLGWELIHIDQMLAIDKNGGSPGFSSYIGIVPEKRVGVVILMNKSKSKISQIGRHLLKHIAK